MRPVSTFTITPALPERLQPLEDLAYNLLWTWDMEALDLFRRLDREVWDTSGHNPVRMLGIISQEQLERRLNDDGFMAHLERVQERYHHYLSDKGWYAKNYGDVSSPCLAYFSFEFGITECLPIYSGGLGVLAGDHMKSASDLGLPLVGVGLLYQYGYFHQHLNADGWQQELLPENDFFTMPVRPVRDDKGKRVKISLTYPNGPVYAQVWRAQIGRVPLYLLDTNIEDNPRPEDKNISNQLYGGDFTTRVRQEILLGIGGVRALEAMGIECNVFHMNEGHSAFLALERIRGLMKKSKLSFAEAREACLVGNVFTTHTPVPAGNDVFPPDLIERHFHDYYKELGLTLDEFLALGRERPANSAEGFCMTVLALRLSAYRNGVSKLHGKVSRRMWEVVWPRVPQDEIPISSITNGAHLGTFVSHDMANLYDRYLGPRWREEPDDKELWKHIEDIPDEELWRTHERRRERLVAFARRQLRRQLEHRGATPKEIQSSEEVLDAKALTLGFARRFATYKRAYLLLRDTERLIQILNHAQRPVQIIFAGKAHPRDNPGKELIRQIVHFSRREDVRHRVVFLEDYDLELARYLVQGVDIWLNTPRRPLEASGTSGMKATFNGALNLSILDGWWDEAYRQHPESGWAIGRGESYDDQNYQDEIEANAIYTLLEEDIAPLFYDRKADGLPRGWIDRMRISMSNLCPIFNTGRMVRDYTELCYVPANRRHQEMMAKNMQRSKNLAQWKGKLATYWPKIKFLAVEANGDASKYRVGDSVEARARLDLAGLSVDDVIVQVYYGPVDSEGNITHGSILPMRPNGDAGADGGHEFVASIPCRGSGRYGYSIRIMPHHEDLSTPYEPNMIIWA